MDSGIWEPQLVVVANSLDTDQPTKCGPDLDPNC